MLGQRSLDTVAPMSSIVHALLDVDDDTTTSREAVEILRWPLDAARRDGRRCRACLWLLPPGELPPELGADEDWIRVPADERDIHARLQRLTGRIGASGPLHPEEVSVGPDGLVERLGQRVYLPRIEASLLGRLGRTPDAVVTRRALAVAAWGDEERTGRLLDSRIFSLRGRLGPLGLAIHTIRGRGYVLSAAPAAPSRRARPR